MMTLHWHRPRLVLCLILVVVGLLPTSMSGLVTVVAIDSAYTDANGTSITISTVGTTAVAFAVSSYGPSANPTLVDTTHGDTITAYAGPYGNGSSDAELQLYVSLSPTSNASHVYTVSGTGSYPVLGGVSLAGTAVVSESCGTPAGAGNAGNGVAYVDASASFTPSEDNCIVISGGAGLHHSAPTATGFTVDSVDNPGGMSGGIGYQIQTTATAIAPVRWTWGAEAAHSAGVIAIKMAGAGGGADPLIGQLLRQGAGR